MRKTLQLLAACFVTAGVLAGCSDSPTPKTEAKREGLAADAEAAVRRMSAADPSLRDFLDRAYGYAVFPSIGKGGFVVGGSYGRGEVYREGRQVGYADVTAISAGLLAGGQTITELVVFGTQSAFDSFTRGEYSLGANASVVALKAGAAAGAQFRDGVVTFVESRGGLMADLSLEGQRFRFRADDSGGGRAETAAYPRGSDPAMRDRQEQLRNEQDRERRDLRQEHQQERQQLQQEQRRDQQEDVRQEPAVRIEESTEIREVRPIPAPEPAPLPVPESTPTPEPTPAPEPQDTTDGPAIRGEVEVGPDAGNKDDAQPRGTSGQAGQTD